MDSQENSESTKVKTATEQPKKMGALDVAAKVLGGSTEPTAMIEAMPLKGYWTSPGGQTLHAAISREINVKVAESRFQKTDRAPRTEPRSIGSPTPFD